MQNFRPTDDLICVYTALIGKYERLNEQPVAKSSGWRFICLTDDPELSSETWECRLIRPVFAMDPVRSQRDLKIRPHLHLSEFDASIWIDNSVILDQPPEALWAARDKRSVFSLPRHTGRETLLDEFIAVTQLGFDDPSRIFEQLNHYTLAHPELLEEPCWWTAILLRQHNRQDMRLFGEIWAAHVLRYSRRDQLSVNVAMRQAGVIPFVLPLDNRRSSFHRWPHAPGRVRDAAPRDHSLSLKPLLARVRDLEQREAEVKHVRASLTWRATEPARWLARRLPSLHLAVPRRLAHWGLMRGRDLPVLGPRIRRAELRWRFRRANGHRPSLDPPRSFNDHMLIRILWERDPRFREYCDKLAMRALVQRVLGVEHVLPILGVWTDPEIIDWSALPERFVLKSSHGSGYVALVRGLAERDISKLTSKARDWLATDFYDTSLEWGYRGIPRRILAEPLFRGPGGSLLIEAEVYTFGGVAALVRLVRGEKGAPERRERWYDRDGRALQMTIGSPLGDFEISQEELARIIAAADTLAADTTQLRIDMLLTEEGHKVLETTPYALAGHANFIPNSWNNRLGRIWTAAKLGEDIKAIIRVTVDDALNSDKSLPGQNRADSR
jgi:hypothetical protein